MEERVKQVLDALEAQCAKREYCTADIRRKALERLDWDAEAAGAVVDALVEGRFVDDRRYAAAYAREKSSLSGWGPVKIRTTLLARGVPRDAVLAALVIDANNKLSDINESPFPIISLSLLEFDILFVFEAFFFYYFFFNFFSFFSLFFIC